MNSNLNKSINVVIAIIMLGLFLLMGNIVLASVDKVTARDCARGITSACQYVK